jgi:hypothetical protein
MTWVRATIKGEIVNAAVLLLASDGTSRVQASQRTQSITTKGSVVTKTPENISHASNIPAGEYRLRLFGLGSDVTGSILIDGNEVASISGGGNLNIVPTVPVTIPDLNNPSIETITTRGEPAVTQPPDEAPFAQIEGGEALSEEQFKEQFPEAVTGFTAETTPRPTPQNPFYIKNGAKVFFNENQVGGKAFRIEIKESLGFKEVA